VYSGQNPYAVAQDFIWANDLPQDHLDQIANFIDKNAAAITLGISMYIERESESESERERDRYRYRYIRYRYRYT